MGEITSLFVHKVLTQAHRSIDRAAMLTALGLDPNAPPDPAQMVSDEDYYGFLEALARRDPNAIDLPLRTGASMHSDEYGAFGLAWKSALTLRGSFARAERYARVLTSVATYEVTPAEGGAYMQLHRAGERRLGLRLSNEATLASVLAISREVCSEPVSPLAVFLRHPAPTAGRAAHEGHFGCPVHFDAAMDALLFSTELLAVPNRQGDPAISAFFDTHLQAALSQLPDDGSLDRQVRIEVSRALSEGVPTISSIAARLGTSGRSLQRRLAARGMSFQSLVDESRRQLAERLLRDTRYSLTEIAFLTGFSEQSAFNRAFRRWAGQTPRSYRLQLRPPGAGTSGQ